MDQTRLGGITFDFLAEPQDVDVDSSIRYGAILTPDRVQQLFAAENDRRAAHEEFEESELRGRQRERLAVEFDLAAAAVQFDIRGLEDTRRRGLSTELQFNAGNHFANKERLDDVIVGAEFEAYDAIGFRRAGCQKDDGGLCEFGMIADAFADIETVGIGEHDIEQNEVGTEAAAQIDRAAASLGTGEAEAFLFEVVLKQRIEIGVVFDQYYSFTHGDFSLRELRYNTVNTG